MARTDEGRYQSGSLLLALAGVAALSAVAALVFRCTSRTGGLLRKN